MNRTEHVQWAKDRAIQELEYGGPNAALASVCSDLTKHPETQDHGAIQLGMMLAMGGHLGSNAKMREWIDGIN